LVLASVFSNGYFPGMTRYKQGDRRMGLSCWDEGSDSDQVTGLNWDKWLVGHCKILAWQLANAPTLWA
jgi:hypothetical protein